MSENRIDAFFYGLYMDADILARLGTHPGNPRQARLDGFHLDLRGKAKLLPSPESWVHGMVYSMPPADLETLYSGPATGEFRPQTVTVTTDDGKPISVTMYTIPATHDLDFNADYLDKLLIVAAKVGLPADYVESLPVRL